MSPTAEPEPESVAPSESHSVGEGSGAMGRGVGSESDPSGESDSFEPSELAPSEPSGGIGRRVSIVLLGVGLLVAWPAAGHLVGERLAELPLFALRADGLAILTDVPPSAEQRTALRRVDTRFVMGRSPWDPGLRPELRRRFAASPHVAEVVSVQPVAPCGFELSLRLRRPVARVAAGAHRLLVDAEGYVLTASPGAEHQGLPLISTPGDPLRLIPNPGHAFDRTGAVAGHRAVIEALGLAEALATSEEAERLFEADEILVGVAGRQRRPGAPDLRLVGEGGIVVLWGRSPRSPYAAEGLSTQQKLSGLALALSRPDSLARSGFVDVTLKVPGLAPLDDRLLDQP